MKKFLTFSVASLAIIGLVGCSQSPAPEETADPTQESSVYEGLPEAIKTRGVLNVGGPVQAPPYIYEDENGEIVGLTPDLFDAVGKELGITIEWMDTPYASAVATLIAGRIDLFTGSYTDTAERQEQVDFVDYYYLDLVTVTQEGNPKGLGNLNELCGYTAAVAIGASPIQTINRVNEEVCRPAGKPEIILNELPNNADVKIQVESGRADFLFDTLAQAEWMMAQSDIPLERFGEPTNHDYAGAAFMKENAELKDSLMYAFQAIMDSGEYLEIMSKWNVQDLAMDRPIYNGATTEPLH